MLQKYIFRVLHLLIVSCQEKSNKYYYVVIARGIFGLTYLASTCGSIIIEIYVDMIRVSHGFSLIDMLFFIAEISN